MKQLDIRKTGEKKYSYSFALLKILMSFVVVMCHFDYEEAASSSGGGVFAMVFTEIS